MTVARETWKRDIRKEPGELEHEADRARAELEDTLIEFERRFAPGHLLDDALQAVKHNSADFGRNFGTQVRNNPVPTILTSIGIAWLMAASKRPPAARPSAYGVGEHASSLVDDARSGIGHAASGVKSAADSARSAAHAVADSASTASSKAAHVARGSAAGLATGAERIRDGYVRLQREQPLVLGAVAVAAGAVLGALLPGTETENRLAGEASDDTTDRLKKESGRLVKRAEAKAADVAGAAARAATDGGSSKPPGARQTRGSI